MLMFDLDGKPVNPGAIKKSFGGDIDDVNGIPATVEIPTTGNYAGVTVSGLGSDAYSGKVLTRTTPGRACARGNAILVKNNMMGFKMQAFVLGGGSSSGVGETSRDFKFGFYKPDDSVGAFVEYVNPDSGTPGVYIKVVSGGVETVSKEVNYQVNNPGEHYPVTLWLVRNVSTGGWTLYFGEGEQFRTRLDIAPGDLSLGEEYIRAHVEWNWTAASGTFTPQVGSLKFDIFYNA